MRNLLIALLLSLLSLSAQAAVTLDANGTWHTNGSSGTSETTNSVTVGSHTGEIVFCFVSWSAAVTSPSATFGGTAMTLLTTKTNANEVSIWYLVNPPTGSKTASLSWTTSAYVVDDCAAFYGASGTLYGTSAVSGTTSTGGLNMDNTCTVSAAGDLALETIEIGGANPTSPTQTSLGDTTTGNVQNGGASYASSTGNVTFQWTDSNSSGGQDWADICTVIQQPPSGQAHTLGAMGVGN
jgi:hypothetical protein